ncbi:hypothetical protein AMTRI_Chr01g129010 [Amborella trichopoda]
MLSNNSLLLDDDAWECVSHDVLSRRNPLCALKSSFEQLAKFLGVSCCIDKSCQNIVGYTCLEGLSMGSLWWGSFIH